MPPKFDRCVKRVMDQGKSKDSAYAICVSMWKKSHGGKSPFKSAEAVDLTEYEEFARTMDLQAAEKEMYKEAPEEFVALRHEVEKIEEEEKEAQRKETLKKIKK